jgi:hypothetical protein
MRAGDFAAVVPVAALASYFGAHFDAFAGATVEFLIASCRSVESEWEARAVLEAVQLIACAGRCEVGGLAAALFENGQIQSLGGHFIMTLSVLIEQHWSEMGPWLAAVAEAVRGSFAHEDALAIEGRMACIWRIAGHGEGDGLLECAFHSLVQAQALPDGELREVADAACDVALLLIREGHAEELALLENQSGVIRRIANFARELGALEDAGAELLAALPDNFPAV